MSKYREFKEFVGLATKRPPPRPTKSAPTADEAKFAHFRKKLPEFHERLKKLPEFDQKAGNLIFYFEKAIDDKNLPETEKNHGLLVNRIKEVELPMYDDLETLRSKATTVVEWTLKVQQCEAFI